MSGGGGWFKKINLLINTTPALGAIVPISFLANLRAESIYRLSVRLHPAGREAAPCPF